MSDDDVLVDLLSRPEKRTTRKPENIPGREKGEGDDAGGSDLTNPNLHHGAEDIYRPVQSAEPLRSSTLINAGVSSATVGESVFLQVSDSGTTATTVADESAHPAQTLSLELPIHFLAPVAGEAVTFSASTAPGLPSIDDPTGPVSGRK